MSSAPDFYSLQAAIDAATKEGISLSELVLRHTMEEDDLSEEAVLDGMYKAWHAMKKAVADGLDNKHRSLGGLLGDEAQLMRAHVQSGNALCGRLLGEATYNAFAVMTTNSCMGKIVAAPTAGSAGVIPGCFTAMQNHMGIPDASLVRGLLNAGAVGMVLAKRAYISGASGGCQAECGSAAAMAASAMVEVLGGSPAACGHAAAMALKSLMGLVCDPVAGLVEVPCALRNSAASSIAMLCADMAMAGVKSPIPVDEVVDAMREVADMMPSELKETAKGGTAATPTGKAIERELFGT